MRKQYNIRWSTKDKRKFTNTVRQFNAKITRTAKKFPDIKYNLPDKISTKDIRGQITTRQDFNRIINKYQRFLQKGAETPWTSPNGIEITRWEKRETEIANRARNKRKEKERKRVDISTAKGNMGTIENNNLKPRKLDWNKIQVGEFKKFQEALEKQLKSNYYPEKWDLYKKNFIDGLKTVFDEDAKPLQKLVERIPAQEFTDLYYENPKLTLDFYYEEAQEHMIRWETVKEELVRYLKLTNRISAEEIESLDIGEWL